MLTVSGFAPLPRRRRTGEPARRLEQPGPIEGNDLAQALFEGNHLAGAELLGPLTAKVLEDQGGASQAVPAARSQLDRPLASVGAPSGAAHVPDAFELLEVLSRCLLRDPDRPPERSRGGALADGLQQEPVEGSRVRVALGSEPPVQLVDQGAEAEQHQDRELEPGAVRYGIGVYAMMIDNPVVYFWEGAFMALIRDHEARRVETANAVMRTLASPTLGGASSAVWRVEMAAGQAGPEHLFDVEQVWTLLNGRARVDLDGEQMLLGSGDTVIVPAHARRRFTAEGPEGFAAIVTAPAGARASMPDGTDRGVPDWIA